MEMALKSRFCAKMTQRIVEKYWLAEKLCLVLQRARAVWILRTPLFLVSCRYLQRKLLEHLPVQVSPEFAEYFQGYEADPKSEIIFRNKLLH
jgi:hypothetical protein